MVSGQEFRSLLRSGVFLISVLGREGMKFKKLKWEKKLIWLLPPNERSSGENKLRIRFLSAKHLFISKQWRCYFSQIAPRSEAVTPFYHCFFLIYVCFFCFFFGLSIRKNMFFLKKKGRTYSFIERISLRTWTTLYFHEWVTDCKPFFFLSEFFPRPLLKKFWNSFLYR